MVASRHRAGHHLTPTHLVARALTSAFEAVPELNVRIVGNRCYPRPRIELFFIAALFSQDAELSGLKVDVTRRTALQLASALEHGVAGLRAGSDREFVVVEGRVVARPMLPLAVTIDHRYVDGSHISRAMTGLRRYLEAPEAQEPSFEQACEVVAHQPAGR